MRNDEIIHLAQEFVALSLNGHIKDFTRKGHCSRCGKCCSNLLPLAQSEIEIISSYVNEHSIQPHSHSNHLELIDVICPFLDAHNRCSIYKVRPLICKAFKCNQKVPSEKYLRMFLLEHRTCLDVRKTFFPQEAEL